MHLKRPAEPLNAMGSALSILQGEHLFYATALKTLLGHLDRARISSAKPNLEVFATGIGFINTFMDHFHHPKEDEFLFRALRRRTTEADEVLRELQFEHAYGPQTLDELKAALNRAQAGGKAELELFADNMKSYAHTQFAHMEREEGIVLPIARRTLKEEDWKEIERGFRENRDPLFSAPGGKFGILFRPLANTGI